MRLQARDLGICVQGRWLLQGIDLDIAPGETFGLIGPNGSGKSTLLRLLAGLGRPSRGEVRLQDRPLPRLTRAELARQLALVEQQVETQEALSVAEVVALGRIPWRRALRPRDPGEGALITQALAQVGMSGREAQLWSSLSGGERQRVQIARALVQRPRILLLDEPTNHLDIHHQLGLLELLGELHIGIVLALHDLNQAMLCDRLGVIEAGRLIACGPPQEVLSPERLRQVFRVEARLLHDPVDGARILRFCTTAR